MTSDQWRYTDDDGVQRLVDVDELRAALTDGRLKPGILVWRRGMKQWLPAASVPELAPNSPISAAARASAQVQIGSIVAPSPSVPPPAPDERSTARAAKAEGGGGDVDSLRASHERRRKETSHGIGPLVAAARAEGAATDSEASSEDAQAPQVARLPVIDVGVNPAAEAGARAEAGPVVGGRPRRITRVGGLWSSADAKREVEETTTTLVRGEGSLAGAPSLDDLGDGATTTVQEDRKSGRAPDVKPAAGRPASPTTGRARISTRPGGGVSTGLPRSTRTSQPPPPKRAAGDDGADGAKPTGKSIPPPPPQHRSSRRRVSGRPLPAPTGAAGSEPQAKDNAAEVASSAVSNLQPTPLPPEAKGPSAMFSQEEATAIAPSAVARNAQQVDPSDATAATRTGAVLPGEAKKPSAPTEPLPVQPAPAAQPTPGPRAGAASQGLPTAELPAGLGADLSSIPHADAATGAASQAPTPAAGAPASTPSGQPAGAQPLPTAELPAYGAPPMGGDPALLELRPMPSAPGAASATDPSQTPPPARASAPNAPPPWASQPEAVGDPVGRDSWPQPPARRPRSATALTIRLSALVSAAVVVGLLLASSFLVGRLTAPAQSGLADVVRARTGFTTVPLFARSKTTQPGTPRPCLMQRAPAQWAPSASKSIPFEVAATAGGKLAIGYAIGTRQIQGLTIDPATGVIEETYNPDEGTEKLSRVVPLVDAEGKVRYAETAVEKAGVRNAVWTAASKPFIVGFKDDACVALDDHESEPQTLWALEPAGTPDALRTVSVVGRGTAVAYRHDSRSWYGWLKEDRSVGVAPTAISEVAAEVGKPMIASNGEAVSLVYADRAAKGEPAIIHWARGAVGKALDPPVIVELPPGGPGGDAIAPAVAGLSGGRWLLMWTEGSRGNQRMLRAQTYARDGQRIGEALQVSPATGSFGQGTVGVEGENAAVVFLLQTRDGYRVRYELWGTVLQCE